MKTLCAYMLAALAAISAANTSSAQSPLRFDTVSHDFGTIAEEGGDVSFGFRFVNVSSEPVVIVKVLSSCGCTTMEFSRKPVLPDHEGTISVTFDPMNYSPGPFSRKVSVFPSSGEAVILTITGKITPRRRTIEESHPIVLAEGIRIDANAHSFGYAEHGKSACGSFEVVNTGGKAAALRITEQRGSGHLQLRYPEVLQPGRPAQINFCYVLPEESDVYGTLDDILDVHIDGRRSEYMLHVTATAIDNRDFFADTEEPHAELSENFIKFGSVKHGNQTLKAKTSIRNTGASTLSVRKLEPERGRVSARLAGPADIAPGQESTLEISLRTKESDAGAVMDRLRIITNDPRTPMRMLRVSAIVTE